MNRLKNTLNKHLKSGETKLMIEATSKRARRKERNNSNRLETIHRCDHCDRDCHPRIGLYSHKKRCPSRTNSRD